MNNSTVTEDGGAVNPILPQVTADEHYDGGASVPLDYAKLDAERKARIKQAKEKAVAEDAERQREREAAGMKPEDVTINGVTLITNAELANQEAFSAAVARNRNMENGGVMVSENMMADILLPLLTGKLAYDTAGKEWYLFLGQKWQPCTVATYIIRKACLVFREWDWVPRMVSGSQVILKRANFADGVEKILREHPEMQLKIADFNKAPNLLNTPAGVFDLRTNEHRPAVGGDLLSSMTSVAPLDDEDGKNCPAYISHLRLVTGGNTELMDYLELLSGYCLTGETAAQEVYFWHGFGQNGKSVLSGIWMHILADYAINAASGQFSSGGGEGKDPYSDADLVGKRLVVGEEIDGRFNMGKIKKFSGGGSQKARQIFGRGFQFLPQCKLLFVSNQHPDIGDINKGTARRLKVVPFDHPIRDEDRDDGFAARLEAEAPFILHRMIRAARRYYKRFDSRLSGLGEPDVVKKASADLLRGEALVQTFVEECCVKAPNSHIKVADFRSTFEQWCADEGHDRHNTNAKAISLQMRAMGYGLGKQEQVRAYIGVKFNGDGERIGRKVGNASAYSNN